MRILWFTLSSPNENSDFHNGGGWMKSLVVPLLNTQDVELGIAFEGRGAYGEVDGGVRLYPIECLSDKKNKIKRHISPRIEEELLLYSAHQIIASFKPDIIHIWGTESAYGLIAEETDIPCILHIQGFLGSYYNALFPPQFSLLDLFRFYRWHPIARYRLWMLDRTWSYRVERERRIFKVCKNYLGRTRWDKSIVHLENPDARYFYCSEMLREPFWNSRGSWKRMEQSPRRIISVLSMPTYKGNDVILKTAKLLKEYSDIEFSWEVYGVWSMAMWEKHLGISCGDVNVKPSGTVNAEALRDILLHADMFVHPSYADNSPNSLCEAQLLGLPIVATYVGGVPTLISDGDTGFLVPANEPYMLAERIRNVLKESSLAERLGRNAASIAEKRHNPNTILHDLLAAYQAIQR